MLWKLFYHGHQPGAEHLELDSGLLVSSWSSERHGSWDEAPYLGVMGIAHIDDWVGYSRDSNDFYILAPWMRGQPMGADHWGVMDLLIRERRMMRTQRLTEYSYQRLGEWGIKMGRSLANDDWQEVRAWMDSDPELPRKSARYGYERP